MFASKLHFIVKDAMSLLVSDRILKMHISKLKKNDKEIGVNYTQIVIICNLED